MSTGLIPNAELIVQLDDLSIAYRRALGTAGSGFGIGEPGGAYGAANYITGAIASIYASADLDEEDDLGKAVRALGDAMSAQLMIGKAFAPAILAYGAHALKFKPNATVKDLDSLLTYRNVGAGGTWTALFDSTFGDVYYKALNRRMSPNNLYFEVLSGAFTNGYDHQYTNGLGKFVVSGAGAGAFTKPVLEGALIDDGTAHGTIDSSKFCGAFPQVRTSGLAGSGTLTVTATVWDPATNSVLTGRTFTFNITANGVNNTVTGGTAPANSLIIVSTNMAIAAGITAGTLLMEGARPAARPLIV